MRRIPSPVRAGVVWGILAALFLGSASMAQAPVREPIREAFEAALKQYREGDYKEAAAGFDKVLQMSPTLEEAVIFRDKAGTNILVEMLREPKFATAAREILKKAQEGADAVRRDPETLARLIEELNSEDYAVRNNAINHCVAAGPFAIPYLLDPALSAEEGSLISRRTGALIAIKRMGLNGIPPLLFAMRHAGDEAAGKIIGLMAMTPDARPLPELVAVIEDMERADFLAKAARRAIGAMKSADLDELPSATEAYFSLATRYYYRDPVLVELVPERDRVLWEWHPAGETFAEKITPRNVATYAWPRLVAEELLIEGIKQKFPNPELLALYAANNYLQHEEALAADDPRADQLAGVNEINETLGTETLYLALQRSLIDRTPTLALRCIEGLRRIGDGRAPMAANSLVEALAYEGKDVRVRAAETLMHLSPDGSLGDPEAVGYVLAAGLGVRARETAAILTDDTALLDTLTMTLREWNMVPEYHKAPSSLLTRIKRNVPPVNVAIIDARVRGDKTPILVHSIRQDSRSASVAVVVLATPALLDLVRDECSLNGMAAVVLPLRVDDLKIAVTGAMNAARVDTVGLEDVRTNADLVRRILKTAAAAPPRTAYPIHFLSEAAAGFLQGYPDDIRSLALKVIERHPEARLRDTVYDVLTDSQQPDPIRRDAGAAFLACLALDAALAADQVAGLRELRGSADEVLAAQAIHALAMARVSTADRQDLLLEDLGSIEAP